MLLSVLFGVDVPHKACCALDSCMPEPDEEEDSDPSGRRAIPSYQIEEEEAQIHRFEWPHTSRTSLEPVTILRLGRTNTTPETTTSELSSPPNTPDQKEADMTAQKPNAEVVPTEPPPPPPDKYAGWVRIPWFVAGMVVAAAIAYAVVRIVGP